MRPWVPRLPDHEAPAEAERRRGKPRASESILNRACAWGSTCCVFGDPKAGERDPTALLTRAPSNQIPTTCRRRCEGASHHSGGSRRFRPGGCSTHRVVSGQPLRRRRRRLLAGPAHRLLRREVLARQEMSCAPTPLRDAFVDPLRHRAAQRPRKAVGVSGEAWRHRARV
jgi:hypothetical protein